MLTTAPPELMPVERWWQDFNMKRLLVFIFVLIMPSLLLADNGKEKSSIIDSIYVNGDSESAFRLNLSFDQNNVDKSISSILKLYQDSGYYYASAEIVHVEKENANVVIYINLIRGPLLTIKAVVIDGIKRSNIIDIKRIIDVSESDTLNAVLLGKADLSARQIDYVRYKPPIKVLPRPGFTQADLHFNFEEMKPVSILAGGGYLPDNKTMIWNLDLKFNNLFGSGRKASIKSEKKEKGHNILELYYRQFVFSRNYSIVEFRASTRDYRDQFYEFNIESRLKTELLDGIITGLGLGYRSVEPNEPQVSFSAYSADFSISSNNLIDQQNPAEGYELDWNIKYSYRKYKNDSLISENRLLSSYNETRLNIKMGWYQPIIKGFIGYVGIQYLGFETAEDLPPVSELYFIGGPGTIRGFRSEQFSALRSAILTIEPRYRFKTGNLFLFYDGAYLNNRITNTGEGIKTDEDFHQGFGFGISLRDSYRSVKLSLGWNKDLPLDQPYLSVELIADI